MWVPTWTRLQSGSYDAMELFSGVATLSRCWREAGYPTCNLDIRDWNPWAEARAAAGLPTSNGNPLDLTTPSGFGFLSFKLSNFMSWKLLASQGGVYLITLILLKEGPMFVPNLPRLLLMSIMKAKDNVVVSIGLLCCTFVAISRGSTFRHYFLPLGDPNSPSCQISNLLASRSVLKILLVSCQVYKCIIYIYILYI